MPGGKGGSKIEVERATLERLRRDVADLKRMSRQAEKDADRVGGELDRLLRQATGSGP